MQIISDSPWYVMLLCLVAGAVYSAALYFFKQKDDSFPNPVRWTLAALRFVSVSLIVFLLMAPLVKRKINQQEKPIIVVAQDNSQSIVLSKDSSYYRTDYAAAMEKLQKKLADDYQVELYTYGDALQNGSEVSYSEQSTDIASALQEIRSRYESRNVGALVLTGDGIYNQGLNPLNVAETYPYPIYTVALGDTNIRKDASISHIRYNRIAYLGNQFPLEVSVNATKLEGLNRVLSVKQGDRTLFTKQIQYSSDNFSTSEQILLQAEKAGLQTYTITIQTADGEASVKNNTRTITVEVIDGHQKVAIIAAAPHPDVAALRRSLESNQNYQVESFLANNFTGKVADYDLLILHNLPQKNSATPTWMSNIANTPTIFVLGMQTDMPRFNALHLGIECYSKISQFNECAPVFNSGFSLFTLTDESVQRISHFPPLSSPFGDWETASNTQVLFTSKIGNVSSGYPLMAFAQKGPIRYAFVCGEGLWHWRMADFQESQNHDAFNTLVSKIVVYTSTQLDKEQFHIEAQKLYRAGENVVLEAALYNDNYELVNQPEVSITLTQEGDSKPQSYQFNHTTNAYSLNLGHLTAGRYTYSAETSLNGKKYTATGSFVVEELQLEDMNLVANHALLNTLAQNTKGQLLTPQELEQLPQLLKQRDDIKTVIYSHTKYTELLNLPLLFILLVLLLGAEWITRKYFGEL